MNEVWGFRSLKEKGINFANIGTFEWYNARIDETAPI